MNNRKRIKKVLKNMIYENDAHFDFTSEMGLSDKNDEVLFDHKSSYGISKLYMLFIDMWDVTMMGHCYYFSTCAEFNEKFLYHMKILFNFTDKNGIMVSESRFNTYDDIVKFANSIIWVLQFLDAFDRSCEQDFNKNILSIGRDIYRYQILRDIINFKCPIIYNTLKQLIYVYDIDGTNLIPLVRECISHEYDGKCDSDTIDDFNRYTVCRYEYKHILNQKPYPQHIEEETEPE